MILLTGSTGFLGKIIFDHLNKGQIKTLNRKNADYIFNLDSQVPFFKETFQLVIHSAGMAHFVPHNEDEAQFFFNTNVNGTHNLLKAFEEMTMPKAFVFISSVAVYGIHRGKLINEETSLLATDPYGKSKIEAEKIIQNWCIKHNVKCTILRLPLIAGPNPTGNLKAMIDGIKMGYYFNIGGGNTKKSIVLASDIAKILLTAANTGGIYNLTDRSHPSFSELAQVIAKQLGKHTVKNMPLYLATLIAKCGDILGPNAPLNSNKLLKLTSELTFDDTKAQKLLAWAPTPVLTGFKIS